jgi:hypothetical protein
MRWAPGQVWRGVENPAPAEIRFPGRPVRSDSLNRHAIPAHNNTEKQAQYLVTFRTNTEDDQYWSKHATDCYSSHADTDTHIALQTSRHNFFHQILVEISFQPLLILGEIYN